MSLYIDFPVGEADGSGVARAAEGGRVLRTAWCRAEPVLAVSAAEDGVRVYNEEGDALEDCVLRRSSCDALAMDWRVRSKVLACGWDDGAVTLWNTKDKSLKEDGSVHSSRTTLVKWSPEGGRLLSADSGGTVAIWRTDYRGRLAVAAKRDVGSGEEVVCCAWMLTPDYREAQRELPTPPQHVFVGTRLGTVALLNLKGELVASGRCPGALRTMSWFEEEQRLVVIGEDGSLLQFRFASGSDELEVLSKVKLSMTSSASRDGVQKAIWTSPGLLATCAREPMVRFWDIPNDQSYFVTCDNVDGIIRAGTKRVDRDEDGGEGKARDSVGQEAVTDISFNPRTRVLAASTTGGQIYLWRFVGKSATVVAGSNVNASEESASRSGGGSETEDGSDGESDGDKENAIGQRKFHYPTSSAKNWESVATLSAIRAPVNKIEWGPRESSLAVTMENQASVMNETILHRTLRNDVAAMQLSAQKLLVQRGASTRIESHVGLRIKGIDVNDTHVLVWNQKKAEVYQFQDDRMDKVASFPSKAESMALYGETVFQTNGNQLEVTNVQGVSRKAISFSEVEGEPRFLHINGKFLAVATNKGVLKVYDVSRREPRQVGSGTRFVEPQRSRSGKALKAALIGEIRSIRCNADGTRVSILSDVVKGQFMCEPDTRIHVWNSDKDEIQAYDFGPDRYPVSHFWDGQEPKLLACEAKRVGKSLSSFEECPATRKSSDAALRGSRLRHVTEEDEAASPGKPSLERQESELEKERLQKIRISRQGRRRSGVDVAEVEVVTLFATDERVGVMMQDSFSLDAGLDALLGVKVPRLFFISKPVDGVPRLKGRTMRDFVGLDQKVDEDTKRALIDFSYHLTIGNMDEAYKAVKLIENVSVWENMAHMCVKTRRLDVAEMCMGNMGHARGAAALRESKKEPEKEAQIAMVAIQLGLLDDAERLYADCGRFDLLNKMLRASGQWTKALEVANSFDRIHLRETHFEFGRHLESLRDFKAAIANYEASGTHRKQVPRMLFEADRIEELESYIQSQCDEELTKWWGQYCESLEEFDRAIQVYQRVGDELSLVRLHCYLGNMRAASEIALNSSNPAASYHLARNCEQRGEVHEAIQFYSRAGRYNHAVRLAKENGMNNEIVNLALRAPKTTMVEAARYLESKRMFEDAVVLFQKGGNIPRALDLCFRAELFDLLASITDTLTLRKPARPESGQSRSGAAGDAGTLAPGSPSEAGSEVSPREEYDPEDSTGHSPEILSRCAEFFIEHNKFDKAVNLYITAGEFETALELCFHQKVQISEDMAESMTLDKLSVPSDARKDPKQVAKVKEHNERRQRLLESIAKCCKKQGSFHLAAKKYTQAGDRLKAMKSLLRAGSTDKIIFFAGVSRSREIYILAANYLQNLDWRNDPEIMKSIISFYSKAKAYQQLASFYDACAQYEIDEYREYAKALGAFKEAVKYIGKVQDESLKEEMLMSLQQRIALVERFVQAQKLVGSDPEEAERICNSLLAHPEVGTAIRVGDIFALLVEHHFKARDMDQAHQLIEKMKARGVAVGPYLDAGMLDQIAGAVGVDSLLDDRYGRGKHDSHDVEDADMVDEDDEIEEDLAWGHK